MTTATVRRRYEIGTREPTRYEVTMSVRGLAPQRVGFTSRLGRVGLRVVMQQPEVSAAILAALREGSVYDWNGGGMRCTLRTSDGIVVAFSGRTERECASEAARR